jgi:hypothetical protein
MYERTYGYRYAELGDHPTAAQIAKAMRSDIKTAKTEGLLPARWSYSVRSDTYSMGQSVDIRVQDCPDAWKPCDGLGCRNVWCSARNDPQYAHAAEPHSVLTDEAEAAKMTLQRIHSAYNHDGSEIQIDYFDVRYHGIVTFEDASSYEFRMSEKARLETRKAARENGRVVGKVTNYKRDGSRVTHVVVETTEGNKVLGCGSRAWRGALVGKAADDAEVTCSRCAKATS